MAKTTRTREQVNSIEQGGNIVIPVIQDQIEITRVPVITGNVRIRKVVSERETIVDEPLSVATVEIEHVTFNIPLEHPAQIRHEGDVTVFPVMEEVITVIRQLMLKEEIRVKWSIKDTHCPQRIVVRNEEIIIERQAGGFDMDLEAGSKEGHKNG